jgi:hypothetical protein
MCLATMINSRISLTADLPAQFDLPHPSFDKRDISENVYRCHLDFIKLSKITRVFHLSRSKMRAGQSNRRVLRGQLTGPGNPFLSETGDPAEFSWFSTGYGDDRDRTDNLCLARAALSQLSYVPEILFIASDQSQSADHDHSGNGRTWTRTTDLSFIRAAL